MSDDGATDVDAYLRNNPTYAQCRKAHAWEPVYGSGREVDGWIELRGHDRANRALPEVCTRCGMERRLLAKRLGFGRYDILGWSYGAPPQGYRVRGTRIARRDIYAHDLDKWDRANRGRNGRRRR